jgi:hypothetical protein
MKMDFQIDDSKLRKQLLGASAKTIHAAAASLYQSAEVIMTDSKENYVPVKTGNLRSTGFVQLPEIDGQDINVTLSYGGPAVDYAVVVHEDLTAHHPHGQAKYLSTPLEQRLGDVHTKLVVDLNAANKNL